MNKPTTAQELEELFGKVDFEKLIRDEILKEGAEEFQRQCADEIKCVILQSNPSQCQV